jgi:hypothetical protein
VTDQQLKCRNWRAKIVEVFEKSIRVPGLSESVNLLAKLISIFLMWYLLIAAKTFNLTIVNFCFLLTKNFSFVFFLVIVSHWTSAQTYTVPGAQVQPQWVMPLWFENGDGQKDTLYYCYDSNSDDPFNPSYDTIFGEIVVTIDTSKFQMVYGCSLQGPDFLGSKSNTTNILKEE